MVVSTELATANYETYKMHPAYARKYHPPLV